jgi:uncharacterized damage-inducible protein DinB
MSISDKLQQQLTTILSGDAWFGSPVYNIIGKVTFEEAYERPPGGAHSIAEILLHMLGWTEEVILRLQGKKAGMPPGGDWPDAGTPDEQKWQTLVSEYKLANVNLIGIIQNFAEEKWNAPIWDERDNELGTGVSNEALVQGLIQHHIYHSGQIGILKRIVG